MLETLLDAFLDTLKIFIIIYIVYFFVELFEHKFSKKISNIRRGWSPLVGAGIGLIPQCGFSVVATDLYSKKHITPGTLIAIFIATSDEALPILLSEPTKILSIIPLLICKFLIAILIGFIVDLILKQDKKEVHDHTSHCTKEMDLHTGCCNHDIEDSKHENFAKRFLLHPLYHSLKICAYILVFNIIFGVSIYFIGEERLVVFLTSNQELSPILAVIFGFIPNCVGSVLLTQLYVLGALPFGSTLGGLIANAGIAYIMLFKQNKNLKENLFIVLTLAVTGIVFGYLINFLFPIIGFNF